MVIDEEHAYRGIGIHPSQKQFAVVAMKYPESGKVAFFRLGMPSDGQLQSSMSIEELD